MKINLTSIAAKIIREETVSKKKRKEQGKQTNKRSLTNGSQNSEDDNKAAWQLKVTTTRENKQE